MTYQPRPWSVPAPLLLTLALLWGCGGEDPEQVCRPAPISHQRLPSVELPPIHRVDVGIPPESWQLVHENIEEKLEVEVVLTIAGVTLPGTVFERHGGSTKKFPKKSYRFRIDDDLEAWLPLFGPTPEKQRRFVLRAAWNDRSFLREKLTHDLIRESGGLASRSAYAELYVNGEYHGFYVLVERIDRLYLKREGLNPDGDVYKAEWGAADWTAKEDPLQGYEHEMGKLGDPSPLGDMLEAVTYTPADADSFASAIEPRLAIPDFLIWQRVQSLALNRDTFDKNYYLYHDRQAPLGDPAHCFRVISWDSDATWGNDWDGSRTDLGKRAWHGYDKFSPRLLAIPEYREMYASEYRAALRGPLSAPALTERIDAIAAHIREAATQDLATWQPKRKFDCEVARLKAAVERRHEVVMETLAELD